MEMPTRAKFSTESRESVVGNPPSKNDVRYGFTRLHREKIMEKKEIQKNSSQSYDFLFTNLFKGNETTLPHKKTSREVYS